MVAPNRIIFEEFNAYTAHAEEYYWTENRVGFFRQ